MNVGLPGTGIGGIFYLISVFFMLFSEIYLAIRGRSNWKRWHIVLEQLIIACSMILTAFLINFVLTKYVFVKPPLVLTQATNVMGSIYNFYIVNPMYFPVTLLCLVILMTHGIHLLLATKKKYSEKFLALE